MSRAGHRSYMLSGKHGEAVVKLIYLRPGFAPPKGEQFMLIQCVLGLKEDVRDIQPAGLTVRINPMPADQIIAKYGVEAEDQGLTRIYFRGR